MGIFGFRSAIATVIWGLAVAPSYLPALPGGTAERMLSLAELPYAAEHVDLDADGDKDILVGATYSSRILMLENFAESGRGYEQRELSTSSQRILNARVLLTADMDGDGDLDLVGSGKPLLNNFPPELTWIEMEDGNVVDRPEKLLIDQVFCIGLVAWDYNGDGLKDVVGFPADGGGELYINPGAAGEPWDKISLTKIRARLFASGNLDDDPEPEFAILNQNEIDIVVFDMLPGTSPEAVVYTGRRSRNTLSCLLMADLDGDNRDEIISNDVDGVVRFGIIGTELFKAGVGFPGTVVSAGDYNGDGRIDLLFGEPTSSSAAYNMKFAINSHPLVFTIQSTGIPNLLANSELNYPVLSADILGSGRASVLSSRIEGIDAYIDGLIVQNLRFESDLPGGLLQSGRPARLRLTVRNNSSNGLPAAAISVRPDPGLAFVTVEAIVPSLAANAEATITFPLSVAETLACGGFVEATVNRPGTTVAAYTARGVLGGPATVSRTESGPVPLDLPDLADVEFTRDLSLANKTVDTVSLRVQVDHVLASDLLVTVTAPSGVSAQQRLSATTGPSTQNLFFLGLKGADANGLWRASIRDTEAVDSGTLLEWMLTVTATGNECDPLGVTPTPSPSPTASPTANPTGTPTATPTHSPTAEPTPSPTPVSENSIVAFLLAGGNATSLDQNGDGIVDAADVVAALVR